MVHGGLGTACFGFRFAKHFKAGILMMNRSTLFNIFLRSLTIQVSFNFWRMQNLGFLFAVLPMIRGRGWDSSRVAEFLSRHFQRFNTHPYLAPSVIGSVTGMEEEGAAPEGVRDLKNALMGPYAAIGDSFFWGALRSVSSVGAVILALSGTLLAPIFFLLVYTPAQWWVRAAGFLEGYRLRRNGIDFIRKLDLPETTGKARWLLLILTAVLAAIAVETAGRLSQPLLPGIPWNIVAALVFLLVFLGVRRGISQVKILYGMAILCIMVSFGYD